MRRHLDPDEWSDERAEIFGLYQQLSVTDENERHHLQYALTGCASLRYMTKEEHQALIEALNTLVSQAGTKQARTLRGLNALSSFDYRPMED